MKKNNLDIIKNIKKVSKEIGDISNILSSELNQPFTFTNSANRKMMFDSQFEQKIGLYNPEVPKLSTGYDIMFGEYTSSFIESKSKYKILDKIVKYKKLPNNKYINYILVVYDEENDLYDLIFRDSYNYNTECYGYLWNNQYLDSLNINDKIEKGDIIKKSNNYDNYNNRTDGTNLLVAFMCPMETYEDAILISESASKNKLSSPLFDKLNCILNDNDIPLNLFGDNENYKSFPDIGESFNGIIMATRRENKEDILFSNAYSNLRRLMISDTTYYSKGKVIDIDIYCNNPKLLENNQYYSQFYRYYLDSLEYSKHIVSSLKPLIDDSKIECSTELKRFYKKHNDIINGKEWINNNKTFSNTIIKFTIVEKVNLNVGDKLTNRYGGKGVDSEVYPDELMPKYRGKSLDAVLDLGGIVGRKNPGQDFEVELNYLSNFILDEYIKNNDVENTLRKIYIYLSHIDKKYMKFIKRKLYKQSYNEKKLFLDHLAKFGLYQICDPSIIMTLDKFDTLINDLGIDIDSLGEHLDVPIEGSDGKIRYVPSLNKFYPGELYIYRLKQIASHKESATSLSTTNIKGLPTQARINKKGHKIPFARTPVQFGEMETAEYEHLGSIIAALNLMTYSNSPIARKECIKMLTGDPYNINIDVPENAKNRTAEILNTFLKSMGLKLEFKKKLRRDKNSPFIRYIKQTNVPIFKTDSIKPIESNFRYRPLYIINKDEPKVLSANHNQYEISVIKK